MKQQRFDIGNKLAFLPYIWLHELSSKLRANHLFYDATLENGTQQLYPPDTKAFLYYSMSPEKPRIAGELRLRVTSSDDVASFESGSDLLPTHLSSTSVAVG